MKLCPKCKQNFEDTLSFCLQDGTPLLGVTSSSDPNAPTVVITPPAPSIKKPQPTEQLYQESTQSVSSTDNPVSLISPVGAAFAVICFFLPWVQQSCSGKTEIITGLELAQKDRFLWILPLMGIVSIAAYFICKSRKAIVKARPYIIGSSTLALFFFIYNLYNILSVAGYFSRDGGNKDTNAQIKSGSVGIVIGFILSIVGCAFMRSDSAVSRENHKADDSKNHKT
jgi:uncharacterized membrane protein HdeD (DUF308 family)